MSTIQVSRIGSPVPYFEIAIFRETDVHNISGVDVRCAIYELRVHSSRSARF